jgi:hypothetical protein
VALVEIDAAGIKAQVPAQRRHLPVGGGSDALRRLRDSCIISCDLRVARERGQRDSGPDAQPGIGFRDLFQGFDAAKVHQCTGFGQTFAQLDKQISATGDKLSLGLGR